MKDLKILKKISAFVKKTLGKKKVAKTARKPRKKVVLTESSHKRD